MIRFFYETIAQTGWTLLALFILGYWAWWEVCHFMISLYKNARAYELEGREGIKGGVRGGAYSSDLEMILPPKKKRKAAINGGFFLTRVVRGWFDRLVGIESELRGGAIRSYERVLYGELAWVLAGGKVLGGGVDENSLRGDLGMVKSLGEDSYKENDRRGGAASLLEARMYACVYKYEQIVREHYRRLKTLRMIATVAPLLGLLGTVVGMIDTFEVISIFGNSNPIFLSDGISKALLTTQAGLILSFPLLFMYVFSRRRLQELEGRIQHIFEYFTHQIQRPGSP
ncbi:hypothetical protein COTS27_01233 [Spirochaetota bacterium]|nr:hypothetical protein COTS27_01233 [Spirochaetota bacterium]